MFTEIELAWYPGYETGTGGINKKWFGSDVYLTCLILPRIIMKNK